MSALRIVVMGTGGVGGYFGGKLARAGEAVTFVARGAHLAAICRDGLRVRSAVEGDWVVKADATDDLAGRPAADAVLLCVKTYDTEPALEHVRSVVGPDTMVLPLQNGIQSAEKIDAALGPGRALGGAAYVFTRIEAPGIIVHRFAGRIVLGELNGQASVRAERLRDALAQAGVPVEVSPDIQRVLWHKYLFIAAQAGLTAVTRCPVGIIRATPESWRLFRLILEEMAALAAKLGVGLPASVVDDMVREAERVAPAASTSMANDLAEGRRLELEALHGHAVRLGERLGVPMPATFAVYAALKPHLHGRPEASGAPSGRT